MIQISHYLHRYSVLYIFALRLRTVCFLIFGFYILQGGNTAAKTYYISPVNARDTNSGSLAAQPWKTFKHAISKMRPGDTLLLMDGTYQQTLDITISGEQESPVTIRAMNDGKAVIDGQGIRETVLIVGKEKGPRHDLILEGFVAANSIKHVYKVRQTQRVILRRLSGSNALNLEGNYHVFSFDQCADILVVDCAAYGSGRILFDYYAGKRAVFRRCWGQWKANRHSGVKTGLAIYGSEDCIVENCIITMEKSVTERVEGIKINRRDGNPYGSRNKICGNIVYGLTNSGSPGFIVQGNELMDDNEWINNASVGNSYGCYQRNDRHLKVDRMTIAESGEKGFVQTPYCKTKPAYDCSWRVNADMTNSSIIKTPTAISKNKSPIMLPDHCSGGPFYGEIIHSWNNIYLSDDPYSGTKKEENEISVNPLYETNMYGLGAYLMVPPPLKGKGESRTDIGAEILFCYQNGQLTKKPLWPWPMEERILSETGTSVTFEEKGGLWKNFPDLKN